MVVTKDVELPTDEELTVQEINLSYPVLQSAAFHLGKYCEYQNNEYYLCKREEDDPRACLEAGKAVTACALEFFQKLKKSCYQEFEQYYTCIDKSSGTSAFGPCRKTQAVYDACVLQNLNIERPPFGYFCEAKIHDSKRPKPVPKIPEYPDEIPGLPPDAPMPQARFNSRYFWQK